MSEESVTDEDDDNETNQPSPPPIIPNGSTEASQTKAKALTAVQSQARSKTTILSRQAAASSTKQIRQIKTFDELRQQTQLAEKAEQDRRQRVEHKQSLLKRYFPDSGTQVVLDFDQQTKKALVRIDRAFVQLLKPHQIEGVRFLYDSVIETIDQLEEDETGTGCILAHSMGLGKTFQVIVFLHSILTNRHIACEISQVMIIVPYNVTENWAVEFDKWLDKCRATRGGGLINNLYEMRTVRTVTKRLELLKRWHNRGGILLMSTNMFRHLLTAKELPSKTKDAFQRYLLSPGPDLVIMDEGHMLKNDESLLNQCMSKMETRRRIMLTGTPLQNNLTEYYVMVHFVKPNLLGDKQEFRNRFQNPIEHGQHADSSARDVTIMRRRIYVLTQMLQGCLHRCGYEVLTPFLQPKHEFVLTLKLTTKQVDLYRHYLTHFAGMTQHFVFRDKSILELIWTHPALLHEYYEECVHDEKRQDLFVVSAGNEWYRRMFESFEQIYQMQLSVKFVLLFEIIEKCNQIEDKLVIFSQSLKILDLIEHYLKQDNDYEPGRDYYRIDGSVSDKKRTKIINSFNDTTNREVQLMLVSTRAGGVGVNLVGANRAVIFDASFNPANDVQAIFRIFRFGQTQPVYVYRFIAYGTMEDRIYKRQIVKQSLSNRVVDEQQIDRHYSRHDVAELYLLDTDYSQLGGQQLPQANTIEDTILSDLLSDHSNLIVSVHEHDSLLVSRENQELNQNEQKIAWQEYAATG